jgi:hypothetical protein
MLPEEPAAESDPLTNGHMRGNNRRRSEICIAVHRELTCPAACEVPALRDAL